MNVEGQVKPDTRRFNEANHLCNHVLIASVVTYEICLGKLILKIAHQLERIIPHQDSADAALALGDQDGAEGAFSDCKVNGGICSAVAKFSGRHTKYLV